MNPLTSASTLGGENSGATPANTIDNSQYPMTHPSQDGQSQMYSEGYYTEATPRNIIHDDHFDINGFDTPHPNDEYNAFSFRQLYLEKLQRLNIRVEEELRDHWNSVSPVIDDIESAMLEGQELVGTIQTEKEKYQKAIRELLLEVDLLR